LKFYNNLALTYVHQVKKRLFPGKAMSYHVSIFQDLFFVIKLLKLLKELDSL